jgi:integrase
VARPYHRLKDGMLRRLGPGRHADGAGLYLVVGASGSRSWIFRYRVHGRLHDYGLGPLRDVTLAMARAKSLDCRRARLAGIDPINERRERRQQEKLEIARAITFAQAAEQFITANRAGWRNHRSEEQWRQTLATYVLPVIGGLSVAAIDTTLVLKVLEPIWATKTQTATRVRGRIDAILNWAATRGYRQGESPARWKGHLENLLPKPAKVHTIENHPALVHGEVGAFMAELRQQAGMPARVLEFAILTAARTNEAIGARWAEIDLTERVWTVPKERMKAHREHKVPLSDPALAILTAVAPLRRNGFVFPGTRPQRPVGSSALKQVLRRMRRDGVTAHGFRSSFRDFAAERTAFPAEIAELSLAHTVGTAVERAYRRSDLFDKRRKLMDAWGGYCAVAVNSGEVVPLRRRREAQVEAAS